MSETAIRTENLTTVQPGDGKAAKRYANRDKARETKPKCVICRNPVYSGKVNQKNPRCFAHQQTTISESDKKYLKSSGEKFVALPHLQYERERQKLTKADMVRLSRVRSETQTGIERGGQARLKTARKLAETLGVSVEDLGGGMIRERPTKQANRYTLPRYCEDGHDMRVCGLDKQGYCRECRRAYFRRRYRAEQGANRTMPAPNLYSLRHRAGYTRRELAERAGVTDSTIYKIESGQGAHRATREKLGAALGVEVGELEASQ